MESKVQVHISGNKQTIKVPATPRVTGTIKAPVHQPKGGQDFPHLHIKLPRILGG